MADEASLPDLDFSHIDAEDAAPPAQTTDVVAVSSQEAEEILKIADDQKKFSNRPMTETLHAAAGTATFSLSDRFLDKTGLMSKEDQQKLAEYNPGAETFGTVVGVVAPAIATLGTSVPGTVAARGAQAALRSTPAAVTMKAAQTTEKVLEGLIKNKIKKEVVRKSIAKTTGGILEGAVFSAGQLAREDALGTAEFNAENLLDAAGTGALYGGLVGAAIPVVGEAFKGAGRTGKKIFDKTVAKFGNPVEDAKNLTGLTTSEVIKLQQNKAGREMLEDLPRWYKDDVGLAATDSADDILRKVGSVKENAGKSLDSLIEQVDAEASVKIPNELARAKLRSQIYSSIAADIDNELVKPYSHLHSFRSSIKKARELVTDFRNLARDNRDILMQRGAKTPSVAAEMRSLRIKMDELAKKFYKSADPSMADEAAFKARDLLKKSINTYADYVNPELARGIEKANKNYFTASKVMRSLSKKALQPDMLISMKDLLFGGVGYVLGQEFGLGLGLARKALQSDLKRKLVILGGLETANNLVSKRMKSVIGDFVSASRTYSKGVRPASVSVLMNSSLSHKRDEGQKSQAPKNKAEAFKNVKENLATLVASPDKLMTQIARATSAVSSSAPETASAMGERLVGAIQFLAQKIPKDTSVINFPGMHREYTPSSLELAKFERYLQIIEQPSSILDDLQNGTLTREHVEALAAVYPDMYNRIRGEVLQNLQSQESSVPYGKKIQIGLLLDIPTDPSLLPGAILNLQAGFTQEAAQEPVSAQGGVKPTVGGAQNIGAASRSASDTDAFLQRKSEA